MFKLVKTEMIAKETLIKGVISNFERLKNDYGNDGLGHLMFEDDMLSIGRFIEERIRYDYHITEKGMIPYIVQMINNVDESANMDITVSVLSIYAYLLYRKKQWDDSIIWTECLNHIPLIALLVEPIDDRFLSDVDLSNENAILAALGYVCFVSECNHGRNKVPIDPVVAVNRIMEYTKVSRIRFSEGTSKDMLSAVLTGMILEHQINEQDVFEAAAKDIDLARSFLLFMNEAEDEDIYCSGKSYGEWRLIDVEDLRFKFLFWSKNAMSLIAECSDKMSKKNIKKRVLLLLDQIKSFTEEESSFVPVAIKKRLFDSPAFPLEEFPVALSETSRCLRESLIGKEDERHRYLDAMIPVSECFEDIMEEQKKAWNESLTFQGLFSGAQLRIAAAYAANHVEVDRKMRFLFKTFKSAPLVEDGFDSSRSFQGIEAMLKLSFLSEFMIDAEMADFLVSAAEFHQKTGCRVLNLDEWSQMSDLLSPPDNILYEWAYNVVV